MRVLLVGSGGREHAIGWKLAQSSRVTELVSLPGNPGLAELGPIVEGISPGDVGAVAAMARIHGVDLVVVGPEDPLAAGIADALIRLGIPVFGPTRAAARLESSKTFAKEMMIRAGVPTGAYSRFTEPEEAVAHLESTDGPYVVKADGLAGGKGVLVTDSRSDAVDWARRWIETGPVVVEEYLEGPEVSVFAVCTESGAIGLEPARDYKRLLDGDAGPNTGGMGSYSPVPDLPEGLVDQTIETVIAPTLEQMQKNGNRFSGFLYAGLVLTEQGPKVLEFNVRLGDPVSRDWTTNDDPVTLVNMADRGTSTPFQLVTRQMSLQINGTMPNLSRFLERLSKLNGLVHTKSISLRRTSQQSTNTSLDMEILLFDLARRPA